MNTPRQPDEEDYHGRRVGQTTDAWRDMDGGVTAHSGKSQKLKQIQKEKVGGRHDSNTRSQLVLRNASQKLRVNHSPTAPISPTSVCFDRLYTVVQVICSECFCFCIIPIASAFLPVRRARSNASMHGMHQCHPREIYLCNRIYSTSSSFAAIPFRPVHPTGKYPCWDQQIRDYSSRA